MFPAPIQKLISHFQKLPGIGPRQATKFALRLIKMSDGELKTMASDMANLKSSVGECKVCFMLFDRPYSAKATQGKPKPDDTSQNEPKNNALCQFCRDDKRDRNKICVVAGDNDALTIEKTKTYDGLYHILGGQISLLEKEENRNLNLLALKNRLDRRTASNAAPAEIILALNATAEGQATALYLEKFLADSGVKIARLAQGLSTGSEIEYADDQTLINALKHRR
ncbi:MAG: recombination protein RecR [Parcubacteria group bacterium]|nr:recombination protein RecR [Parcubacteria group bacterium]